MKINRTLNSLHLNSNICVILLFLKYVQHYSGVLGTKLKISIISADFFRIHWKNLKFWFLSFSHMATEKKTLF